MFCAGLIIDTGACFLKHNGFHNFASESYRRRGNSSTEICQVKEEGLIVNYLCTV